MKTNALLLTLAVAALFLSCEKQPKPTPVPTPVKPSTELRKITLTATLSDLTKSVLQDGEKVLWSPGDKISVFYGTAQAEFTSTNTEPAATAMFEGYLEVPSEVVDEQLTLFGIYPYSPANSINDGIITVSLPSEQSAVAGSFADDLSISAGMSTGSSMTFYNVCGLVEVSVVRSDVKGVSIQGLNNEDLAGTLSVGFGADGIPSVQSIVDGKKAVSVVAGEGAYLTPGQTYYIVLAPALLSQGAKIGIETDEALIIKKIESAVEVKRSTIGVLSNVDDGALPEYVPFQDANFKAYCVANFDTDNDGEISMAEAQVVTSIDCRRLEIVNLAGIKYFTNLAELDCSYNRLVSLDVSDNRLLSELNCENNDQIKTLDVSNNDALRILKCGNTGLSSLDVSANTRLEGLDCSDNGLTSLVVSNNTALAQLICERNGLTSLDVSNNADLILLNCGSNQLTMLDVTANLSLTELWCFSNSLTVLDVSNNTALKQLHVDHNQLTSLDVSNNNELTHLDISDNHIDNLDVSQNPALYHLLCNDGQLTSLDVSNNTVLYLLLCNNNQIVSLDVSNNPDLRFFHCKDNPLETIYISIGQSFQEFEKPEGVQLVQRIGGSTENFSRENW